MPPGLNPESLRPTRKIRQFNYELPRSKLRGYQNIAMRIYPKGVTPECFNRGSTVLLTTTLSHVEWVGGPVPVSPVVSPVEPPIEAFGNDGL